MKITSAFSAGLALAIGLALGIGLAFSQAPRVAPELAAELKTELEAIRSQIKNTEADDARYTGGLVKSLIAARLAVLRQSEAMLQQRSNAATFGIALRYTVDGKEFVPPPNRTELLAAVEAELAGSATKLKSLEGEVARYSGGLVYAMALSTLATARQTHAMLEQKCLALKYGLPQFVGFAPQDKPAQRTPEPTPAPKSESNNDWEIVSIQTRITETNDVWSKYAWKLTIKNRSARPQVFSGQIEFQDGDGFIVDTDTVGSFLVEVNSEAVSTGYALIRAESRDRVARTIAKVQKTR